ncbi:MAG: histidine kinase [Muribaculaceae bacterium]|nr:histidine kinase [Muribaculaceae bacterium]MDE7142038.1 histidine kinase [Muribaculaceae bacterium]
MTDFRDRKLESWIYAGLWILVIGLYLLDVMSNRAQLSKPVFNVGVLARMARTLLPFMALFLVSNHLLIPRLLLRNRMAMYFAATTVALALMWCYQYFEFSRMAEMFNRSHHGPPPHMRPLIPMPLIMDFTYSLLVVGGNLAVALMFQRFDDALERESLMKTNAEARLEYLKAQINPHFYMNMLNNIHGMIEIDSERAQAMVIDMSRLMRYMLYDSSKPLISLADEVAFLQNYLRLMRLRYPENRLSITTEFPPDGKMRGISVPPLLTLVFIENAFKHGVSYRDSSFVGVSVEIGGGRLRFTCVNSNHARHDDARPQSGGIGLRNAGQRLQLLYGDRATLEMNATESVYTVNLSIPCHETENADNR